MLYLQRYVEDEHNITIAIPMFKPVPNLLHFNQRLHGETCLPISILYFQRILRRRKICLIYNLCLCWPYTIWGGLRKFNCMCGVHFVWSCGSRIWVCVLPTAELGLYSWQLRTLVHHLWHPQANFTTLIYFSPNTIFINENPDATLFVHRNSSPWILNDCWSILQVYAYHTASSSLPSISSSSPLSTPYFSPSPPT
jgi:hypothetical protein